MATPRRLGWGIIGLGKQAGVLAQAIQKARNAHLVAVLSGDQTRANAFPAKDKNILRTSSFATFLAHTDLDAVVIASPNTLHAAQGFRALHAGKHVLIEKPMALSALDGRALVQLAKKEKRALGIGFHLRHKKVMQEARHLIQNGAIGTIRAIDMQWSIGTPGQRVLPPLPAHMRWREKNAQAGGGALMARGVHLFDLFRFLTGLEPQTVTATVQRRAGAEITASALIESGDCLFRFITSKEIPYSKNTIVLSGSAGVMEIMNALDPLPRQQLLIKNEQRTLKKTFTNTNPYCTEIEDFSAWVLKNTKTPVATGEDGLRTLLMTDAFYASVRHGRRTRVRS